MCQMFVEIIIVKQPVLPELHWLLQLPFLSPTTTQTTALDNESEDNFSYDSQE